MIRTDDPALFLAAYLDTPLGIDHEKVREAHRRNDPDYLLDCPGTCLKSRECDPERGGFPKHHGRLVRYDAASDFVVVRGHDSPVSPACVWVGTVAEYLAMWRVD